MGDRALVMGLAKVLDFLLTKCEDRGWCDYCGDLANGVDAGQQPTEAESTTPPTDAPPMQSMPSSKPNYVPAEATDMI